MELQILQNEIKKWSDGAFGMYRNSLPMVHHLKKEVDELIVALDDVYRGVYSNDDNGQELLAKKYAAILKEYADCFMLLIDSAAHFPIRMDTLLNAVEKKLEENKSRKWGKPDENGVVEHIRDDSHAV